MTEKMTLEQVRDWLLARTRDGQRQGSVFTSDYQLRQMADAIDAHLAQPAQAVDVGMVREVIAELAKRANTGFNTNDRARCGHWATQLTRTIGNTQADG